jgi:TRAP-type C4-dicarboxylate transport system permease small subunit
MDALDRVIGWVTAGILAVAFLLMLYGIFLRYVLQRSGLDWAYEVTIFAVAWAILLAISRVEHRSAHMRMDLLLMRASLTNQFRSELLGLVTSLALSAFFVYAGILVVQDSLIWDERSGSSLRLPMWVYFSALSVSFGIHVLFLIHRLVRLVRSGEASEPRDLTT